jgi:protocatechuate 3,4-dioxygenase beta subunit
MGFWSGPIDPTNIVMAQDFERNLAAIQEFDAILTNLDLNLQPGITISGSVKGAEGAPVTNAAIDLKMLSGHSSASVENKPVKVDARGSFSFPALPQGREYEIFDLTAKGYGLAFGRVKPEEARTNQYEFPTFLLKKADRVLAGQVLGMDGKPVPEVPVRFSGQGQRRILGAPIKSDSNGHFVFDDVCEGPVTVSADYDRLSANAAAQGGDTNVILQLGITLVQARAFLTPPLKMTGTVRDPRGNPVPGAKMSLFTTQVGIITTQTGSDGRYEFTWQKRLNQEQPDWLLTRDLSRNLVAVHQVDETTTNLDLILEDGITLSTHVSDSDGSAVAEATAKVILWHGNRGTSVARQTTTPDERGSLRMAALPQGQKYWVEIGATNYTSTTLHVEADETRTNHLELPPCILTRLIGM